MMTQKERITALEREVSDLRALVAALQARPTVFPYSPPQNPWVNTPRYVGPPVTYNNHLHAVAS